MRFQNLKLIRYGKFTDVDMVLPKSDHDFHFIVGPNEAGKSTVRNAIAELIFGFPPRSAAMAFLHPQPELRLGGHVADDGSELEFVRIKALKNTLRSPSDVALPDDALLPFLGTADREFFEQMFGLDHAQLVRGGQTILDASKDVSQVLFQSAAGIAGLGKVKDALTAEADKLWAPRQSAGRSYYVASARWEEVCRELKSLTVRTKVWTEAQEKLAEVDSRIEAATKAGKELNVKRITLERVRRLAPSVQTLRSKLADIERLGVVLELPADAAVTINTAAADLSVAETIRRQREQAVTDFETQRDEAVFDPNVLASKDDIESLEAFSQRVRDHYTDLNVQKGEFDRYLGLARAAAKDLGWSEDEVSMRSTIPAELTVREVQRLVTSHGKLLQAKTTTAKAVETKQEELDAATLELTQTATGEVTPSLRSALSEAQSYKKAAATHAKHSATVKAAERALESATAELGRWAKPLDAIRRLMPPSAAKLTNLVNERQRLESARNAACERAVEAREELESANLNVKQFVEARHIVTSAQVREARSGRDAQWRSIKEGTIALATGAPSLDSAIVLADELADTQLDSATEAVQLQSLRHQAEIAELNLAQRQATADKKEAELVSFDRNWQDTATSLELPGIDLADVQSWFSKRDQVIAAADACDEKQIDMLREVQAANDATELLRAQIVQAGLTVAEGTALPALLLQAETFITETDATITRRTVLSKQIAAAQKSLRTLTVESAAADAAYETWLASWSSAVDAAGLSSYVKSVSDAELALVKVEAVRQNLDKADATKRDRIDTMNADLAMFDTTCKEVLSRLGETEDDAAETRSVVRAIFLRLREAEAAHLRWTTADQSLQSAREQRDEAKRAVELVQAKVSPLLTAAGVATLSEAAPLVERSDNLRELLSDIAASREALTLDSDGLGIDAVHDEVDGCDLTQLMADVAAVTGAQEQVQSELRKLAEERLQAQLAFQAIDGGKDAAFAESRRQEALAEMVEASERYVKVTTAVQLLTWAIDRYRDQKQGPMLARAGAIFSTLTLGRYSKLFVDYEKTPLSLSSLRADGMQVEVAGMSEGTRDQLYLALRLAALELHLGKSKALPFIADDLFINFDDERSTAGLEALRELSTRTQVLFLSHHDHLLPRVRQVFGAGVNVVELSR